MLKLIGKTPLVRIRNINPNPNVKLLAKLEYMNPGNSVKDRAAYSMIKNAMDRGDLKKGGHIVEATSGNTGIALAMIGNLMGIKVTLVMPDTSTMERQKTMKAFGANLILTPGEKGIEYSRETAERIASEQGCILLNQFDNPDNPAIHYHTTGPEIWKDTAGHVTHFVSAMGTTGTISGTGKFLKEKNSSIEVIGCQPKDKKEKIPGIAKWEPAFLPKIYNPSVVDRIIEISRQDAIDTTRKMVRDEGILAGMSSGCTMYAALKIASEIDKGVIVVIVCDSGERYLSSDLFE